MIYSLYERRLNSECFIKMALYHIHCNLPDLMDQVLLGDHEPNLEIEWDYTVSHHYNIH